MQWFEYIRKLGLYVLIFFVNYHTYIFECQERNAPLLYSLTQQYVLFY